LRKARMLRMTQPKNRRFTENEKIVYRLGFLAGEAQLQQAINVVKATNSNLVDELLRLDFEKPVLGDPKHVTITFREVILKKFIKNLRDENMSLQQRKDYASMLQAYVRQNEKQQKLIAEKIRKGTINDKK
jgi:hypothetical protein